MGRYNLNGGLGHCWTIASKINAQILHFYFRETQQSCKLWPCRANRIIPAVATWWEKSDVMRHVRRQLGAMWRYSGHYQCARTTISSGHWPAKPGGRLAEKGHLQWRLQTMRQATKGCRSESTLAALKAKSWLKCNLRHRISCTNSRHCIFCSFGCSLLSTTRTIRQKWNT